MQIQKEQYIKDFRGGGFTCTVSHTTKVARRACNTAQYNITPSRKAGCRIRARSHDTLEEYKNEQQKIIKFMYTTPLPKRENKHMDYSYHKPSTMSVNGLVNFGTILEVVNDLKPCAEIKRHTIRKA